MTKTEEKLVEALYENISALKRIDNIKKNFDKLKNEYEELEYLYGGACDKIEELDLKLEKYEPTEVVDKDELFKKIMTDLQKEA